MYPRVFVLCTGRCGSAAFIRACSHITNYSAGHETRSRLIGDARFDYPVSHIEADNRLAWLLGRLDYHYGDDAFFVHLTRDDKAVADSYSKRFPWNGSITRAYRDGILMLNNNDEFEVSLDFVHTVNSNIELFLHNKANKMAFTLETAERDFKTFWHLISAQGDLHAALKEWQTKSNTTQEMLKRLRDEELKRQKAEELSINRIWRKTAKRLTNRIKKKSSS